MTRRELEPRVHEPSLVFLPLLYGCHHRVGWRFEVSVVRGLELVGRYVADGRVQTSRVVPINPTGGDPFDVIDRAQRSRPERRTIADRFVLERPDRGLGEGVVFNVCQKRSILPCVVGL